MPGGQGTAIGWPPGGVREHVPSAFFIKPGMAVGVPEPAGGALDAGGVVGAGAGAGAVCTGVGAGAGAGPGGGAC